MELKVLNKFYKNKKVFITGHTGFKGIWLLLILKFLGAKVKGYSLQLSNDDNFVFFKKIKKNFYKESIFGDILKKVAVARFTRTFGTLIQSVTTLLSKVKLKK